MRVDFEITHLTFKPIVGILLVEHADARRELIDLAMIWPGEFESAVRRSLAIKTALVNQPVMMATELHEVLETRISAIGPVFYMVTIDEPGVCAARETTALVPEA